MIERARAAIEGLKNKIPVSARNFEDFQEKIKSNNILLVTAEILSAAGEEIPPHLRRIVGEASVDAVVLQGFPIFGRTVQYIDYCQYENRGDKRGNVILTVKSTQERLGQLQSVTPGLMTYITQQIPLSMDMLGGIKEAVKGIEDNIFLEPRR